MGVGVCVGVVISTLVVEESEATTGGIAISDVDVVTVPFADMDSEGNTPGGAEVVSVDDDAVDTTVEVFPVPEGRESVVPETSGTLDVVADSVAEVDALSRAVS